jgi:hypothetical protein
MLLFGAAVLIVIWIVSPASSSPQTPPPHPSSMAPKVPAAGAEVASVRLPEPAAPPAEYAVPVRDPFAFDVRPRAPRAAAAAPSEPLSPARPVLPSLVAILTDATPSGAAHRAALADGDRVRIVAAGDVFGAFRVSEILSNTLSLVDANTGETYRLSLR